MSTKTNTPTETAGSTSDGAKIQMPEGVQIQMKNLPLRRSIAGIFLFAGLMLTFTAAAEASKESEIIAVSAKVSSDYLRAKLPDGSYRPETFAFAPGGEWKGEERDDTIDKLQFTDVAKTLVQPLASQNYFSSKDPRKTGLLIMVYWGATDIIGHPSKSFQLMNFQTQQENARRDKLDMQTANMLGYESLWNRTVDFDRGPFAFLRQDLIDELEDRRYFVVLMAYDFQLLWKQKKHKVLWETRFSIREHGNDFDSELASISRTAAQYFGQSSKGVARKPLPEGQIESGELRVLDDSVEK